MRGVKDPLTQHTYIATVNPMPTTITSPEFRCVLAITLERLVGERLTEEIDDAVPVSVGVQVPVAVAACIVIHMPDIVIERAPVAPRISVDGSGDCEQAKGISHHT